MFGIVDGFPLFLPVRPTVVDTRALLCPALINNGFAEFVRANYDTGIRRIMDAGYKGKRTPSMYINIHARYKAVADTVEDGRGREWPKPCLPNTAKPPRQL